MQAGAWQVNIRTMRPDGSRIRERLRAPVSSRLEALRWGMAREQELLFGRSEAPGKEIPTLAEFAPRYMELALANRQKPSAVAAKERLLRVHLLPALGRERLDTIRNERVERLKASLREKAPKTVNNVLTVLSKLLKTAVEWEVLDRMPCVIRLVPVAPSHASFHDFEDYERLVEKARKDGRNTYVAVLLAGEAGLRAGEIRALEWSDVDLERERPQISVRRSEWYGQVTAPKGGRPRVVPVTARLAAALREHRHLRGPLVICEEDGSRLTEKTLRWCVGRAGRMAGLERNGVHLLRHTYCSHLAMRARRRRRIQELAGHADLSTTQRYMHLSPAAKEDAVQLLEKSGRQTGGAFGAGS
ncbi:MAG: site-specific integrase [Acidobacteriota bacterium]